MAHEPRAGFSAFLLHAVSVFALGASQAAYAQQVVPESERPIITDPLALRKPKEGFEKSPGISDPGFSKDQPVLLEAERIEYDQAREMVVAAGKVQVAQGESLLLADELVYDRKSGTVYAFGNASVLEPSGNVYFSDQLELSDDMKTGVIRQFSARLADDSLFAAERAHKRDENITELERAVYSPCKVECAPKGEGKAPLWQIATDEVTVDQQQKRATYGDTTFELYGIPVLYTPYFSHALPGADNESGFLMPEYRQSNNVGTMLKVPYYYAMGKDRDATIAPIFTSKEGVVMTGEYRQRYDNGQYIVQGSLTRPQERDSQGRTQSGNELRGNIDAVGNFLIDERSDTGFDIHRVTDDTYLRRYGFRQDTLLTSRVYAQQFEVAPSAAYSYARVQALAFQGLSAQDDNSTVPLAVPLAEMNYLSQPGRYGERFNAEGNLLALHRENGADTQRLATRFGWRLPYISEDGQVFELGAHLRSDVYVVNDLQLANGRQFDGTTGRLIPEVSASWRYPFISQGQENSLMLEPIVSFVATPGGGNSEEIPNEDSRVPEFTETNLFSENRYAGWDRVETGPRLSYGLRGQAQLFSTKFVDWLIGQHVRLNDDRTFPYSNDLESRFSDYVGKVGFDYRPLNVAYRFRLDKDTLTAKRNELDGTYDFGRLSLGVAYLSLNNDPILATKEVVNTSGSLRLSDEWTASAGIQHDLDQSFTTATYGGLVFGNECTQVTTQVARTYTRDRDIEPSTSFVLRLSLKNLE